MALKTTRWDSAEYLQTDEDITVYLKAVLDEGNPSLVNYALGVITRARVINQIADETDLARDSLCNTLSAEGHPEFATVMKVISVLGLRLHTHAA